MTDAMNFFQSVLTFKNFSPINNRRAEVELAMSLQNEARTLAAKAAEEMHNGRTTQILAFEAKDKNKARIFAEITVWHNGRAAEKFRKAAERFEEAGKIQITKRKAFNSTAKKMMRRAAEAETAVRQMNEFLTQK